jgi:hypothetical protein
LFESKPLFGQFTVKQADLLSNIVKQSALYGILKNTQAVRQSCIRLWAGILPNSSSSSMNPQIDGKNFHDIDMFHLLVSLCLSMPNLYADKPKLQSVACGSLNCFNIFKLVLQAHCVQIVLTKIKLNTFSVANKTPSLDFKSDEQLNGSINNKLLEFFHFIVNLASEKNVIKLSNQEKTRLMKISAMNFAHTLMSSVISFLRCSALFFANLTNVTPNDTIVNNSGTISFNFKYVSESLKIFEDIKL